jgi:hypothetical protein
MLKKVLFMSQYSLGRNRVVDPDPDSVTLVDPDPIGNPDPGARKLRNFSGNNALFSYFKKKFYH